ncbi:sigma-54-dependent Fis family transcriptional regulator [Mangrovimicrobium sediminis]|uniref:Sigma-54-dependent Fis family transcriptional regulator n=1 Tax=Mangrovimicrobium sediminis TaxID=2562682 RepID=A0A4Z0LVI4_9GAMM|nr:sigma-54-dependent Fis family transcriptional regulator [Haliea sp. SAOS-164]TGD71126.1 sigma-54-dependent Fis family transcriptional regulator [Haliea sp. SAOS-164]
MREIEQLEADDSDLPTVLIGSDYRLLACNRAYRENAVKSVEIGRSRCFEITHGYTSPCHENGEACPLQRVAETGLAQRVLHVHHTRNGARYCDITMEPVYATDGRLLGYRETLQGVDHASHEPRADTLCGQSAPFRAMLELINRVAPTDVSVLLQGESGTGKELVARAIHDASERRDQPFVVVECTGLNESLFESELFGYSKGAFTGANRDKPGLVDAAHGGTLFLDEIGDIPLQQQVKLLRLLETGTYRAVGSVETRRANFRLVSASHKNLPQLVEAGEFRQDLYFRLAAFPIHLPALRERIGDLPLLCDLFVRQQSPDKRLTPAALAKLSGYDFPGNVRELRNLLQRACLMADDERIEPGHLPPLAAQAEPAAAATGDEEIVSLKEAERRYLQRVSRQFAGSTAELASRLGISERTLYRKLADTTGR